MEGTPKGRGVPRSNRGRDESCQRTVMNPLLSNIKYLCVESEVGVVDARSDGVRAMKIGTRRAVVAFY